MKNILPKQGAAPAKVAAAMLTAIAFHFSSFGGELPSKVQAERLFGPNVRVFSPSDSAAEIDREIEEIFRRQHHSQFGDRRYALMFLPGDYTKLKTVNVGYYTQVLGLGRSPMDVRLSNVKTPAALENNNATCNFWVGIENLSIADTDNNDDPYFGFQWAVSQAAPARRLFVERKAVFDWFYGWASGGYVADCIFQKQAGSFSQQQYYSRSSRIDGGFYGVNWNNVIHGCTGRSLDGSKDGSGHRFAAAKPTSRPGVKSTWRDGGSATIVDTVEVVREKPFVFYDAGENAFKVFAPQLRRDAKGPSWSESDPGKGRVLDVARDFFVARADRDDAASINAALASGRHLLLSPGVYRVSEPLRVSKPGTIVLGLGEATILPANPEAGMILADVDGLSLCGVIFDAGESSSHLLVVGERGASRRHKDNPSIVQDVVYRVGGTGAKARTGVCVEINSNDVIVDHTWIWRADHGANTGWNANTAKNGLVVNGGNVVCYGLFVEHFQEYDVLWNGEDGRTFFLQNEKCYDPPGNAAWMSHDGSKRGYSAYKVAPGVKRHYAVGLGVYDVFINTGGKSVFLDDAIEVPDAPGVVVENACTVEIANGEGPLVGIDHIVNGKGCSVRTGKGSGGGYAVQRLLRYSGGEADEMPDYYKTARR